MPIEDMELAEAKSASGDEDLCLRLKREFRKDAEHWSEWRKQAREDYKLYSGDQWDDESKKVLLDQARPVVSFNRIQPTINVVSGHEISNRQEIRYIPREMGDVTVSELVTSAAKWFREEADAEDEESDAFRDTLICGMGWLENRLDHERDPDGKPTCDRLDPLEFLADRYARKPNLTDARRIWRVRKIARIDAQDMFPDADPAMLNASWADSYFGESNDHIHNNHKPAYQNDGPPQNDGDEVTIVECQWFEREDIVRFMDPMTGQESRLSPAEFGKAMKRLEAMGIPGDAIQSVKQKAIVRYRAFLGREVLQGPEPTTCPKHFSYQCVTGLRDQATGTWFGLVRPMADPQRWANKFFSQTLHIINSTAKGGVMMEAGAAEDQRQFEASWARSDAVTWLKTGALSAGRIQPKPQTQFPAGIWQMMDFAITAIRDATGVNQEMLGLRDASQPGVLEMQRKQAGMTIISAFFDSLRRYRKISGEIILYILQNDVPDGRIVRVVGKEKEQNVALMKDQMLGDYDIIVDEAPTSPNVKDRTWSLVQPLLPMLPPQAQLAMLDYAPLPESAVQKIKDAATQALQGQQQQQDPKVAQAQQMQQLKLQEAQADRAMKQQQAADEIQLAREKAAAEHELAKVKLQNEMVIEQMRASAQVETERMKAAMQAKHDEMKLAIDAMKPAAPQGPLNG